MSVLTAEQIAEQILRDHDDVTCGGVLCPACERLQIHVAEAIRDAEARGEARGRQQAADLLDTMTREWLAEAEGEHEADRVGYPPYHFMRVRERLLAPPRRQETTSDWCSGVDSMVTTAEREPGLDFTEGE